MASDTRTIGVAAWLRTALLLAVGGGAFLYVVLWLAQGLGGLGGRVFEEEWIGLIPLSISLLIASFFSLFLVKWIGRLSFGAAWQIVFLWWVTSLLLGTIGKALGTVSLPIFLAVWAGFGLLLGRLFADQGGGAPRGQRRGRATAQPEASATRRGPTAVTRSTEFGRIPSATVVLLTQQVSQVRGAVLGALPATAPRPLHDFTIRAVLARTLTDWWHNGNTHGLTSRDIDDLRSFVALAVALASGGGSLLAPEDQAAYRAVLATLLDDWLANWNSNGQDGPPRRP